MRLKNSVKAITICIALAALFPGNAIATALTTVKQAWRAQDIDQLRSALPDRAAVDSLIKELYGDTIVQPTVGEYELADLNGDGTVELVVTIDFSGRGFYNTIDIINYADGKLHSFSIRSGGVNITNLKSRIVDLNGDRFSEILIPKALAPYAGAAPIPVIDDVYAWNGAKYEKSDTMFKNYYRDTVIPRLKSALEAINHGHSSASEQSNKILKRKYEKEIDAVTNILNN